MYEVVLSDSYLKIHHELETGPKRIKETQGEFQRDTATKISWLEVTRVPQIRTSR